MSSRTNTGGPPPKIDNMVSLKVDNITYETGIDELRRVFMKYGDIGDIYIPRDRYTGQSRGFAFIRFYDRRDAEDAMDSMDGRMMDGRRLRVQLARYGRPSPPRWMVRGGGGGGSRRGRSRSRSRSRSPGDRRRDRDDGYYGGRRERDRDSSRERERGRYSSGGRY